MFLTHLLGDGLTTLPMFNLNTYKMKKISAIIFTVFLNLALFSCTPTALQDDTNEPQACCGDGTNIPPPPPSTGVGG
ncbi:hypothetical protein M0G43_08615 [Subsaxibacter sp. CAU 1640]|uniref:hypothetical protein n=1 Tax=Subsaxibacter sp. CAU 1640 TaxID=2933271 RepID=UPI0020066A48|nr:hypothetical protein [Subsaxibacter sp. CAU 1640]MCK7590633.1 hypothetical protein [Subsaxibacter sp. CAU 1640]